MMPNDDDDMAAISSAVADGVSDLAEELLADGAALRPVVYMLSEVGHPYVGCVVARASIGGSDTADAVWQLGELPSVMRVDRIVLAWENRLLSTLLGAPGNHPTGVMTVEATKTHHTATWHPYDAHDVGIETWGAPVIRPEWRLQEDSRAALPAPVAEAIRTWRSGDSCKSIDDTVTELEGFGFEVALAV